ncbi:right-handed parallel beta-helix repeat-containing protein [Geodermatophilus sp. SYSU D00684]
MDPSTTTRTRTRARAARVTAAAGAGVLLFAALPAGIASANGGPRTWDVKPGESIQAVVDQAASGDTIRIAPGTYTEAVCVVDKGLTIQGAGRSQTTIRWKGGEPAPTPCWEATNAADLEDDDATLADNVSGLFFLNPDSPVVVKDLRTKNHTANGIAAWGADGFTVTNTKGIGHDRYGILAADSRHNHIVGNIEQGVDRAGPGEAPDSGTAGISVGDSANSESLIAHNQVDGYNLGIFLRESSGGKVEANTVTGNCIGILTFDDSGTEIPDRTRNVEGGDWRITGNTSAANNRWCLQGREGDQRISGVGMAVVNASHVQVSGNVIRDHVPTIPPARFIPPNAPPLTFPTGGLVLLTFLPPPPPAPQGIANPGQVSHVAVVANTFGDNRGFVFDPATGGSQLGRVDIHVVPPIPPFIGAPGPGLQFRDNACDGSIPPDICGNPLPL